MSAPPAWWPAVARTTHADLASYRLVGASACADRITSALASISLAAQERGADVVAELTAAGNAFCDLKPDTALYRNIAEALVTVARTGDAAAICDRARQLTGIRRAAQREVVARTTQLLADARSVLVHDYSSMVMRVLESLPARTRRRVVVTAGEPLGKGMQVAREAATLGYSVTFVPDMSVARTIDGVDAYLTGVETFYGDGSLANTVGTTMLGLLCTQTGVPVIAPAETLKLDRQQETAAAAGLSATLLHPWPPASLGTSSEWSIVSFVLDPVPASVITSFVTEQGASTPLDVGRVAEAAIQDLLTPNPPVR